MGKVKEHLVPFGILKIIEFFFLLIAWTASMGAQRDDHNHYLHKYFAGKVMRPAFHIAMCVLSWVFVTFWLVLGFGGVKMKWNSMISASLHFIFGVLLIVAASMVADVVASTDDAKYKTSVAFGIISAILLFLDAFLYLLYHRYEDEEPEANRKPEAAKAPAVAKQPETAAENKAVEVETAAEEPKATEDV